MRLTLFIILAALLLVTATARRGSKTPPAPVLKKHILIPQWGFPYGWGLGPGIDTQDSDAAEEKEKEMKQVKRGTFTPTASRWSVYYCTQAIFFSHYPSIYSLAQLSKRRRSLAQLSIRRRARRPQCLKRSPAGLDPQSITTWKTPKIT
jgi:hypothetical protein